jgi:hypothetical protein
MSADAVGWLLTAGFAVLFVAVVAIVAYYLRRLR